MFLNGFKVSSFRNIESLNLELEGQHAAFIGPNGAGKTNLLEAVYFSLKGRPFRSFVHKEDLFPKSSKEGSKQLQISLDLTEEGQRRSFLEVQGDHEKHRFVFRRNDKKESPSDLSFRFPVIAFSPQDHELIRGGPDVRRRFLDQVFSDICPGYFEVLSQFEHALKQRNKLLKQIADSESSPVELHSWNEVYVERSTKLFQLKMDIFPEFLHHFIKICEQMNNSFYREIELYLKTSFSTAEEFKKTLEIDLGKDLGTKWTHSGPHRDDLMISIYGQQSRATASQGQGRLIGLLLRWTHAQWMQKARQEKALFILDDFSSELDQDHRDLLIQQVFSDTNQVLWSATELPRNNLIRDLFKSSKLFSIFDGSIADENLINSTI